MSEIFYSKHYYIHNSIDVQYVCIPNNILFVYLLFKFFSNKSIIVYKNRTVKFEWFLIVHLKYFEKGQKLFWTSRNHKIGTGYSVLL